MSLSCTSRTAQDDVAVRCLQGRQNDIYREFRTARQERKLIVSPHWLLQCDVEKRRVDEASFPHTYNPAMALSLSVSSSQTPGRPRRTARSRQTAVTTAAASSSQLENVPPQPAASATSAAGAAQLAAGDKLVLNVTLYCSFLLPVSGYKLQL